MGGEPSLADQLRLLLGLPASVPVSCTPSFHPWVHEPADTGADRAICLIDTRDPAGRRIVRAWDGQSDERVVAGLVLAGSGPPGGRLRRALRRLRHPGSRRLSEGDVLRHLQCSTLRRTRLAFDDGPGVPTEFAVDPDAHSTGAAFLLTPGEPFRGGVWPLLRARLSPHLSIDRLQVRERGAAIAMVRDVDRSYVIRVVPPGRLQDIVLRNTALLTAVRAALHGRTDVLQLLPEPVFTELSDRTAVLAETCLAGALAWRSAHGQLAATIRAGAIAFLDELRAATAGRATPDPRMLIAADVERVGRADFLDADMRRRLVGLHEGAATTLASSPFTPYASHGDFGYGNILVDPATGRVTGVIDWDTARLEDFPGIDRVNLEIQVRRNNGSFPDAVRAVWRTRAAHDALEDTRDPIHARALFTLAVCRYVTRALSYPAVFRKEAPGFDRALAWLESPEFQAV